MKIGFSFGRCVRDIVKGKVKIDDVLCIIARTHMPKEESVEWVIGEYMHRRDYLQGLDEKDCLDAGLELWRTGRVIEPRANGVGVLQVPSDYVWMDLFPTNVDADNVSVTSAWEAYRMLIGLTTQLPEHDDHAIAHGDKHVASEESLEAARRAAQLLANSI